MLSWLKEACTMNQKLTTKQIALIAMGVALITVCSWISIPATVPFTLQTFAVCLVTAVFGLRMGIWAVLCYILLGAVGAPVFSGFKGGFGALLGTTGGYIIGFLFTALIVGAAVKKWGRNMPVLILSMALGILLCILSVRHGLCLSMRKTAGRSGSAQPWAGV